jgi:hypothetical protein
MSRTLVGPVFVGRREALAIAVEVPRCTPPDVEAGPGGIGGVDASGRKVRPARPLRRGTALSCAGLESDNELTPAGVRLGGVNDREQAWDAILGRLPPDWRVTAPGYDPGRGRWEAVAIGPKVGDRRGPAPGTVIGEGPDELAALRDLAERLA